MILIFLIGIIILLAIDISCLICKIEFISKSTVILGIILEIAIITITFISFWIELKGIYGVIGTIISIFAFTILSIIIIKTYNRK